MGNVSRFPKNEKRKQIREQVEAKAKSEQEEQTGSGDGGGITSKYVRDCLQANELGDALLYTALLKDKLLYNKSGREWLHWDGHHWRLDNMDECLAGIAQVTQRYFEEAKIANDEAYKARQMEDSSEVLRLEKLRDALYARIRQLRTNARRKNVLEFAHTCGASSLAIAGDELDANPLLLACKNGVLDLRTGEFRDGRPTDYLFKAAPVVWQGIDVDTSEIDAFMLSIFDNNQRMVDFMRRAVGYSLTGLTMEQKFLCLCGEGSNGKGVLYSLLTDSLGPLSMPIPAEMLLDQGRVRSSSGPSADIVSLRGLRVALASETGEGRRFDTPGVKWLTGGDMLVGRLPYDKRPVTFKPTHTLFLATNNKPHVSPHDKAFWRRVLLIDFPLNFVDEPKKSNERLIDRQLEPKLLANLPGFLAWCVRGCLEWQEMGLLPPPEVLAATKVYQQDEDDLLDFVGSCCVVEEGAYVSLKEIFKKYLGWAEDYYGKSRARAILGKKQFSAQFEKHYKRNTDNNKCPIFQGIRLVNSLD